MDLEYSDLLARLIDLQGKDVVASYSVENNRVFNCFGSQFLRGHDANSPEILGHDGDSVELEFANGTTLTVDPTQFKGGSWTMNDNGQVLKFQLAAVQISLIFAEAGDD